ncbi:Hypothetical predicted protein [Mytilus galloprovincialis]|uniref:Reverse transcriptase domain-containing protein n=1 Tax=Mytilus galloprovincialis TaxID=29158 RepID=A0A8B6FC69_MYTGA|nr:Hypothetical predicted protein [Mytilus galloprovincialis]
MDTLRGSAYMSTLDMAAGYWQIEIDEKDRHKTAFVTKYGLFEHVRLPFGLCNSPATFSRVIQLVLKGLTWRECLAYLDDVIVLGHSFDDHLTYPDPEATFILDTDASDKTIGAELSQLQDGKERTISFFEVRF